MSGTAVAVSLHTSITADLRIQTADDEFFIESRNPQAMLTASRLPR